MPKIDNRTFKSSLSAVVSVDSIISIGKHEYSMTPGAANRMLLSSISPEGKGCFLFCMKIRILKHSPMSMFNTLAKPSAVCFTNETFANFFY